LNSRVGEGGGPDALRRRLLSITAGSEALAAWLCFMMERRADARAHLDHAEPLAREVGDTDTLALILMLRSDLMSPVPAGGQGGFPEQARGRLAEALSVVSDGTPLPILAPLLLRSAEEAAFVGDEDAALAHLETAGRAVDTVGRRHHYLRPTWGTAPNVAGIVRSFHGNIYQMLGRTGEAIRLLEPALTSRFPADQPMTLIDLASAHAKEGDLGRAVELLGNAADLVAEHGLPVAGRRLVGVRSQQLAYWNGDPTLRELDERIALL
jgi:tetratricopeptide (TPR) repeat protein